MSGGLDALETIGKKTMQVLSEGDPGKIIKSVHPQVMSSLPPAVCRVGQQEGNIGGGAFSHFI